MKEDVIKQIEKLSDQYEYWMEMANRETDPKKKREAINKYKYAIEEVMRLEKEHHVSAERKISSAERASMEFDHKRQMMVPSREQLNEKRIETEFSQEMKLAERNIREKIKDSGNEYIKSVIDEMRTHNVKRSRIEALLSDLNEVSWAYKSEKAIRAEVLGNTLWYYFVNYFSGEVYIEDYLEESCRADTALEEGRMTDAIEIMEKALKLYDTALKYTQFSSGSDYYLLEKTRIKARWDARISNLLEQKEHQSRQEILKNIIVEIVKAQPGILQASLYKTISEYSRSEVSEAAYYMNRDGKLSRKKKGNTYELFLT